MHPSPSVRFSRAQFVSNNWKVTHFLDASYLALPGGDCVERAIRIVDGVPWRAPSCLLLVTFVLTQKTLKGREDSVSGAVYFKRDPGDILRNLVPLRSSNPDLILTSAGLQTERELRRMYSAAVVH
jgi:hypothetical protein